MQGPVCCENEAAKCGLFYEAFWVLTDDEVKEDSSCRVCTWCGIRVDLLLCYVVIALGLCVYVPLYILCCGTCNFVFFLVEKSRERRSLRETREREASDGRQRDEEEGRGHGTVEEESGVVGEKETEQSLHLEIREERAS